MTRNLPPDVLHALAALSWLSGECSNCPAAYQPADGLVTEVADEARPCDPPTRYCRRCVTVRLVMDSERPAVMDAIGTTAAQQADARVERSRAYWAGVLGARG